MLLLAFLALSSFTSAACSGATYEARLSSGWYYCKDLKIYNNDSNYAMVTNTTVLFNFDHAALVTAGKSWENASDVIFTRGGVEIDAINLTPWNTANVLVGFRTNTSILRTASDTTNFSVLYGGDAWTVPDRYRNASKAFTWADDFTRANNGSTLNDTGSWWTNAAGMYSAYQLEVGTMTFHTNGGWWNVLAQDRWAFPSGASQYNTSIVARFKNETGYGVGAIQYIGGRCGTNNTVNCGGGSEMAWLINNNAGVIRVRYGVNTAPSTAISPMEPKWYFTDMRFGPNSTPTQFWRSSGNLTTISSNPGNVSTIANGTWYPAIGTDGSFVTVNFTYDFFGLRYYSTLVDPSVQFGGEEINSDAVYIYYPSSVPNTYYNLTRFDVIYHLNSTLNSSSMMVWKTVNGVTQDVGYLANGSVNTTTATGFTSGYNTLSIFALESAVNASSSINVSVVNGLNISVYNATQGTNTFLNGVNLTVWTATNQSSFTATTPYSAETRTIPNGAVVSINATKSGYSDRWFDAYIYSNASLYYDVSMPLCRLQEFRAASVNGTNITSFSIYVYNSSGFNSSYTTTNGTIIASLCDLPLNGSPVFQYAANYHEISNFSFGINSSSELNLSVTLNQSGIVIVAFDEASCLSTCQRIYLGMLATNGSSTVTNYSVNYFINYSSSDLPQGEVTFTINNTANGTYYPRNYLVTISPYSFTTLNAYLLNSTATTISASYCTITAGNSPISNPTISIARLFGSSYVTVAQLEGGSDGCATFYLDALTTYQITASATGYTSSTVYATPKTQQYLVLTSTALTKGFKTVYSDDLDRIESILQPVANSLVTDWVLVNFTVYSINSTLTNWGLLCDYNGTTIYAVNVSTSPAGGSTTTNITINNKTVSSGGTGSFFCYGLFDRNTYNTTYVNRTFYLNWANTTYTNTSISGGIAEANEGGFSKQFLTLLSIIVTLIVTAGIAPFVPVGSGIVSAVVLTGFAFFGWLEVKLFMLFLFLSLAYTYFNSRQF